MATLPNDDLSWLVAGTRPLGTTNPSSPLGALNVPLNELLENDKVLQDQVNALIISGGASITSVNGKLGPTVTLIPSDIGAADSSHTHDHSALTNIVGGDVHLTGPEKSTFDGLNGRVTALEGGGGGFVKFASPVSIPLNAMPQANGWSIVDMSAYGVPAGAIAYGSLRASAGASTNGSASVVGIFIESDSTQGVSAAENEVCYSGSSDASNGAHSIVVRQVFTGYMIAPRTGFPGTCFQASGGNINSFILKIYGYHS